MTKTRVLTLVFFITLISFSACRKSPEKIGKDLQPTNSYITVEFSDAQDIVASTFTVPYLNTKQLGYAFIGNMNDRCSAIPTWTFSHSIHSAPPACIGVKAPSLTQWCWPSLITVIMAIQLISH